MRSRRSKNLPVGLSILRVFYLINAFLALITNLVFFEYLDIVVFGEVVNPMVVLLIKLLLLLFPIYLAFGISSLRKEAYFLIILYHIFFVVNGVLTILYFQKVNSNLKPILEIVLKPAYKLVHIRDFLNVPIEMYLLQIAAIMIGVFIIIYILPKRKFFKA